MDERPANVVEDIVRDGIAEQRDRGLIPRTNQVHKYVQGIVERMERRESETRHRAKPSPAARPVTIQRSSSEMEKEYQTRLRRRGQSPLAGSWTVTRTPLGRRETVAKEPLPVRLARTRLRKWAESKDPFGSPKWEEKVYAKVRDVADRHFALQLVKGAITEALERQRFRLLISKPEWAERLKINPLATQGQLGPEAQARAHEAYRQVFRDSVRVFGPWLKVPAKKLIFT